MTLPPQDPGRKTLPHHTPHENPNQSIIIYVTMLVQKRRPLLTKPDAVQTILNAWQQANHWQVGRYVIMPDHLHFFCAPVLTTTTLTQWMQYWRSLATRNWPRENEKPIWQKDFFDRQIRTGESYHQKFLYLWQNPVVAKICSNPETWPYQGEQNKLTWHEPT